MPLKKPKRPEVGGERDGEGVRGGNKERGREGEEKGARGEREEGRGKRGSKRIPSEFLSRSFHLERSGKSSTDSPIFLSFYKKN